jgi:hypothetical protein
MKRKSLSILAILGFLLLICTYQLTTTTEKKLSQQHVQLLGKPVSDEEAIRELVVNYVTALQTYDYKTINRLDGLEYCTPDFRSLVENYTSQIITRIKRDKESHRVKSVDVNIIEIGPQRTAYVTYIVKGSGTSHGDKPVSIEARGDLVCREINKKWLIELDDLEPRKDVLIHIYRTFN